MNEITTQNNMDYVYDDLGSIKKYVEANGLYVKSDCSNKGSDSYIILGGGSSFIYRARSKDKINGLLLICHSDNEDLNRMVTHMGKQVYPNGDPIRPNKVQVAENELPKVVELLKMNPQNAVKGN